MNTKIKPYTFLLTTILVALLSTGCASAEMLPSNTIAQTHGDMIILPDTGGRTRGVEFTQHDRDVYQEEIPVYEKAILTSPLVKAQHEKGLERRKREYTELSKLFTEVQSLIEETDGENLENLYGETRAMLKQDLAFFEALQQALKPLQPKEGEYPIKTNRMHLGLQKALALTEDEFYDIIDRSPSVPQRFDFTNPPDFNIVDDRTHMFSSGDGIAIKIFLSTVYRVLSNTHKVSDLHKVFGNDWVDTSPWVHITPLPESFVMTEDIKTSPYFYDDRKSIPGVIIFHNGFAFGGHRCDKRYPQGKEFGPFDCSSWIASITQSPVAFSTVHQYIDYHIRTDFSAFPQGVLSEEVKHKIVQEWQEDSFKAGIEQSLTPIQVRDPQVDLQPGCIHGERVLKIFDVHNLSEFPKGSGGHTGLFLGIVGGCGPDARALTLGFTRDIEDLNIDAAYVVDRRLLFTPNPFEAGRSVFYHKPINF